jgi:glycosyltransferase involved in cell wall biosynthesis
MVLKKMGLDVEIGTASVADIEAGAYDVLWLQQHCDAASEIAARAMKDLGGLVVYDADDWLFGIPPSWGCYGDYRRRGSGAPTARLRFHERLLGLADVVTTTTEALADRLRDKTTAPVEILPNGVMAGDWDVIPARPHGQDGPVLGWFGTANHWDDWWEIVWAVDTALERVCGYLALMGAPELLAMLPKRLADRTFIDPWRRMGHDFQKTRELIVSCDVGLAWATDRLPVSLCRSPLKALQWGAAGVPCVASETVYGALEGFSDRYGFTAGNGYELLGLLLKIFDDYEAVARARAEAWREAVLSEYAYEHTARQWASLLQAYASV